MKGMSPGIALIVEDGDGEKIMVHVGPKWFLGDSIAIKRGDKLKITGCLGRDRRQGSLYGLQD